MVFFLFCFFAWWYSGGGSFGSCGLCFLDSRSCYVLILGLWRPSQHFRIFFMYLEPFLDRFCGVTACIVLPGEWVLLHGGQFNYGFYLSKYKSWHGNFPSRTLHWKDALCYVLHVVAVLLLLIIFCMVRIKVNFPFLKKLLLYPQEYEGRHILFLSLHDILVCPLWNCSCCHLVMGFPP